MDFVNYFLKADNIVSVIEFLFFGVVSLILLIKTGNTKPIKTFIDKFGDIEKEENMKYRLPNYQEKEKVEGQTFDKFIKCYKVNKLTNELEETGEVIDIQEMVNSSVSTCMTEVLSRFFPDNTPESPEVALANEMQDDLEFLSETYSVAEKYRDMFNLGADMSVQDIFKIVEQKSNELNKSLENNATPVATNNQAEEVKSSENQANDVE